MVVGEGAQRVTQHAIDPLGLGVGVLVVSRADEEARTDALRELLKRRTRELGVDGSWSATSTSEAPSPEPRAISRMICAAAAVSVERVGTAWTLPERWSTCTCTWSKPDAVMGRPNSQSTPITPPRREGSGRGLSRALRPTRSALVRWQTSHDHT